VIHGAYLSLNFRKRLVIAMEDIERFGDEEIEFESKEVYRLKTKPVEFATRAENSEARRKGQTKP
jgi:hypothetical protein